MNALVVKNLNADFADFVKKLHKKGKSAKVIIVAIMRKLMNIIFGMLKNDQEFDKSLALVLDIQDSVCISGLNIGSKIILPSCSDSLPRTCVLSKACGKKSFGLRN